MWKKEIVIPSEARKLKKNNRKNRKTNKQKNNKLKLNTKNEKKIYNLNRSAHAADNDFTADEVVGTRKNNTNHFGFYMAYTSI